ncbi:MAG: type II secretion system F family protein [Pirellulaceae bacterium]|nr:type II secretion system F family protein [Pirellulaceae bacterium]
MPQFSYIARNADGQQSAGTIEAASRHEVLATLAGRALFPITVEAETKTAVSFLRRRPSGQVLATTLGQLADLMKSGVPLLRSLDVLKRQASHAGMREVLNDLHRQVESGASLAEAMQHHEKTFRRMTVSMVRAGGEGGFLEESLARVAGFIETQEDLKGRTIGAIAYPAVLAGFGALVIVFLLVFVVPRFEAIFETLRQRGELPVLTDWLLATSHFLWRWIFWITAVLVLLIVAAARWLSTEGGGRWQDLTKLRLPVAGNIFRNLAIARFCRVLGTLLSHGVPIIRSLRISSESAGNRVLAEAVVAATENISAGETLAQPLSKCRHFPDTIVEMIAVAEESANLEKVLIDIADSLERTTFRKLDLAVRLLEPVMLLIMASVVLLLVIALLLPMFKMSMTMQ